MKYLSLIFGILASSMVLYDVYLNHLDTMDKMVIFLAFLVLSFEEYNRIKTI